MSSRVRILLLFLLVTLLAGFVGMVVSLLGGWRPESEPTYQGRSLSLWLEDLDSWNTNTNSAVFAAMRTMGSNAVPALVRISLTPPGIRMKQLITEKMRAYPQLKRLTPEGVRILWFRANVALSILGPDARTALAPLLRQLHATDPVIRALAMSTLGFLGPVAEPYLPALLVHTNDSEATMRGNLMLALGMIGRQPQVCLPALTNGLGDPDPIVRGNANMAISFFGGFDFAKPARVYKQQPSLSPKIAAPNGGPATTEESSNGLGGDRHR
jgi:hypothetical protein